MNEIYDSIIIGAGISGMTSAIYLKRYNLNILLLEKEVPGGQISKASLIENYPGFKSVDGATFSMNLLEQINNLKIKLNYEEVIDIKLEDNLKIVKTNNNIYKSKTIVIATGRTPKKLKIDNKYIGRGISYCATCDGMFYKDKEVVVIGGGNSALEESLYLSNICKKVTILNRSDKLKADSILVEKITKKNNVIILHNSEIKEIIKDEKIKGIILNNNTIINCDGIFVYIGLTPNIPNINNLELINNYIKVDNNMKTNIEGIYAIGDITKKDLYQLITAASDGAIAAFNIKKFLCDKDRV